MKILLQAWHANDLSDLAIAGAIVAGLLLALVLLRMVVARVLRALAVRTETPFNLLAADAVGATRLWLLLPVALYFGASALDVPAKLGHVIDLAAVVALMVQSAAWGNRFITRWLAYKTERSAGGDGETVTALGLISFLARLLVWTIALLLVLNQLSVDITALVTGLGIGGVAVALALQNILGDLFASLSIVLDKPFVVGDFIVVGDLRGTVERVGIKTTRIRSLDGEQLIVPNGDLLKSRIHNYKRMSERRVLFNIGIAHETPHEKLATVSAMLREIVMAQPGTRFDRAHFKEFGDSALVLEIVYFVLDSDFNRYMDAQEALNLEILRRFRAEGIAFAYPPQTLFYRTGNAGPAPRVEAAGKP